MLGGLTIRSAPTSKRSWKKIYLRGNIFPSRITKRLAAYVERCTARPAFKRAFDAQIGDFREAA
jgi:hypothetical protein